MKDQNSGKKTRNKWYFITEMIAQLVKNPPAMQETLVHYLGQ